MKRPVWRHRFTNQAATIHFLFQYKFLLSFFLHHVPMLFLSVFNLKSLILYFPSVLIHFMSVPQCTFLRDKNNISRYKSLSLPVLIVKSDLFLGNFNVHFFDFFLYIFFFTTGKINNQKYRVFLVSRGRVCYLLTFNTTEYKF